MLSLLGLAFLLFIPTDSVLCLMLFFGRWDEMGADETLAYQKCLHKQIVFLFFLTIPVSMRLAFERKREDRS